MMKKLIAIGLSFLLVLPAVAEEVDKRLEAAADGHVDISNIAGAVTVTGWTRNEVEVTGTLGRNVKELVFERDGDKVTIKVLEVDLDRERISLSIRQTLKDPWEVFSADNEVGSVVEGKVIKTVPFGAFVSVADGVEGLVHVSEIAVHRVESPELELSIGQSVQAKITELDDERRRVSLSIKQALPDWKEREAAMSAPKNKRPQRREFEREFGPAEEERPPVAVDASLEAILQELKERGIGRR